MVKANETNQALVQHKAEEAAWEHNLAVIKKALSGHGNDGEKRLVHATSTLDREIKLLKTQRDLRKQATGDPLKETKVPKAVVYLDSLIAEKRRRRKELVTIGRNFSEKKKPALEKAGTAEFACKPARKDPIEELGKRQHLSEDQMRAAFEIRQIYEAVARELRTKTSDFSQSCDRYCWQPSDIPTQLLRARRRRFLPWAETLRQSNPIALDIVIRIAVFGVSVFSVARKHRMGWEKCVETLADGLDLYWKMESKEKSKSVRKERR